MPAKLPQGLYWRGDTIWGRTKVNGHEYRRSLRTANPREAERAIKDWKEELKASASSDRSGRSFVEAVVKWEREVLPTAVKPSVQRRYLTSLVALAPVFRRLKLSEITSWTIAEFVSGRSGAVSNSTIRRDLTALSHILSAAMVWGWIASNPAHTFNRRIIKQKPKTLTIPTDAEFEAVLSVSPPGAVSILRLLDQTGMRENEAVTLERTEINAGAQQIALIKTKTNRPRVLNWQTPGGNAGLILSNRPVSMASTFLFLNRNDEPYSGFSSDYQRLVRQAIAAEAKAGRPFRRFRAHDLRHRFAIRWLKAGGDIYRLSRHLGHTSVKTTERYLDYLTDDEIDAIRGVVKISRDVA